MEGRRGVLSSVAVLAFAAVSLACAPNPWDEEKPFTVHVQLDGSPTQGAGGDLTAGPAGLRFVHRVDVFRPLDFQPRNPEIADGCLRADVDNQPSLPVTPCRDLRKTDGGAFLSADDLRPAATGDGTSQPPVVALLTARGAVLEVANASNAELPVIEGAPDLGQPLTVHVRFSGQERYWAKYWSKCRGCLGLVWVEARWLGQSWCTTPMPDVVSPPDAMALSVDLTRPPADDVPLGASGPGASRCGAPSWFEAIYRLDDGDDPRPEHVIRFRP